MPGVGKSQIILEFARDYRQTYSGTNVFHVDATGRESLAQGFQGIHKILQLPHETQHDAMTESVKQWFTRTQHWLLLVDNVVLADEVRPFLPSGGFGVILFTMRDEWLARTFGSSGMLELLPMDDEEATDLILKGAGKDPSTSSSEDRHEAAEIGRQVGNLPLALEQSAACISYRKWRLSKYLDLLQREKVETLNLGPALDGSQSPFPQTFTFATQRLSSTAMVLLKLSAHLDHHNVPMSLLQAGTKGGIFGVHEPYPRVKMSSGGRASEFVAGARSTFRRLFPKKEHTVEQLSGSSNATGLVGGRSCDFLRQLFSNSEELERAVLELHSAALVGRKQEGNIWIHDLVAEMALHVIDKSERYLFVGVALQLCERLFPGHDSSEPAFWSLCEEASPHVVVSLRHALEQRVEVKSTYVLQTRLGRYYRVRGRYSEALPLLNIAFAGLENSSGYEDPSTSDALRELCILFDHDQRIKETLELVERVLPVLERVLGPDHRSTLDILAAKAFAFEWAGQYVESLELRKRVLAVEVKVHGPEHPETMGTLHNMASVFGAMERYDEALELYERVLAVMEKVRGPDHPETLIALNNKAMLFETMKRYDEALELLERLLHVRVKTIGSDHPYTVDIRKGIFRCREAIRERASVAGNTARSF